jgi:Zn-dependent protease with chaperone function
MENISRLLLTFLVNSLWQTVAVAAVAAGCSWLLRSSPARLRHLLWVAALAFSLLVPIVGTRHLDASGALSHGPSVKGLATNVEVAAVGGFERPISSAEPFPARPRSISLPPVIALLIMSCYLAFILWRLVRFCLAWKRARRIAYVAFGAGPPHSSAPIAERCRAALGIDEVPILCSVGIEVPLTLGVAGPVIVLPAELLEDPSLDTLTAVIGHEMAHIKRRDFFLNLVYELLYLPISFHPAAALVKRRIAQTRELACDEMVAERLLSPSVYARSLVYMASRVTALCRHNHTLGVFDAGNLEERVMKLTDGKQRASARAGWLSLTLASIVLAISSIVASAYSFSAAQSNAVGQPQTQLVVGTWKGGYNVDEMIKAGLVPDSEKPREGERFLMVVRRDMQINLTMSGERLSGSFMMHQWLRKTETNEVLEMQGEFPLIDPRLEGNLLTFAVRPTSDDPSNPDKNRLAIEMTLTGEDTGDLWFTGARQTYDTSGKPSRVVMKKQK